MKTTGVLALFLSAVCVQSAMAGIQKGNGGDVVVCGNGYPRLYDYYEAEQRWKLPVVYSSERTVDAKVRDLIGRIARLNPRRATVYTKWFESFYNETEFLAGVELIDIPDTGDGFIPSGCVLKQAAVQRQMRFPNEKRFTVQNDIFMAMDDDNKAGLILHELILREASEFRGHESSINARYFHAQIASRAIESMDLITYARLVLLLGFDIIDIEDTAMNISSCAKETLTEELLASFRKYSPFRRCINQVDRKDVMNSTRIFGGDFQAEFTEVRNADQKIVHRFHLHDEDESTEVRYANTVLIFRRDTSIQPVPKQEAMGAQLSPDGARVGFTVPRGYSVQISAFNCNGTFRDISKNISFGLDPAGLIIADYRQEAVFAETCGN